jgi:hypothetical protein
MDGRMYWMARNEPLRLVVIVFAACVAANAAIVIVNAYRNHRRKRNALMAPYKIEK